MKRGFVLWLMGPTSSGKTTLANGVTKSCMINGQRFLHYDGDEVRSLFGKNHGFSSDDRLSVVKTLAYFAGKAADSGNNVVVSALTAFPDARQYIKKNIDNLIVGYVECCFEVCAERDPKGLYEKARSGKIETLIGYNTPYPEPEFPDFVVNTEKTGIKEGVDTIHSYLKSRMKL